MIVVEAASASAVYTTGLVNLPGPIPIPIDSEMSVLQAIAAAGGTREYLDVKEGTLVRELANGENVHVKLALSDMMAGKVEDLKLKPGDVLMIPHTVDTFVQDWARSNLLFGPFRVGVNYDPLSQYNVNRAIKNQTVNRNGITNTIASDLPLLFRNPFPTTP
jgi:hypothetical protein